MSQAQHGNSPVDQHLEQATGLSDLVNRLTQELANARRSLAFATDKLGTTGRTLDGRTQEHFNTRFVEMWNLPADKLDRLTDGALLTMQLAQVKDPQAFLALVTQRKSQPETEQFGLVELTDGRTFECHVMPQRVGGKRVGTVTRFHDVTQRQQLNRMVAALETQMPQEVAEARASAY